MVPKRKQVYTHHTTHTPHHTTHTTPHHTHLHAGLPKIAAGLHEELFHSWSQETKMMVLEPHLMTATVQDLEQFMPHHSLQRNGLKILGEEGEGFDKTGGKVSYPKSTAVTIACLLCAILHITGLFSKWYPTLKELEGASDAPLEDHALPPPCQRTSPFKLLMACYFPL